MTHPVISDLLFKRIASAVASADAVKGISHLGLRGRAREIFVNELLLPLPGQIVGTGAVVDSMGNQSGQSDIIVFDKSILPPELFSEGEGLFPIEACAYVIEVKSKLTAHELKAAHENAGRLWSLQPLVEVFRPFHVVFAFGSDLKGDEIVDELNRYRKLDLRATEFPQVRVFCVAGKGYAYFDDRSRPPHWRYLKANREFEEIANFLGGFANTLPDFRRNRISISIPYGNYLLPGRTFERFEAS